MLRGATVRGLFRRHLWLLVGTLLLIFSNWRFTVPLAAWLFPVFFIRFLRLERGVRGLAVCAAAFMAAGSIMMWWSLSDKLLFSPQFRIFSGAAWGFMVFLPFLANRIVGPRIPGFATTLVFPLTYTSMEYVSSLSRFNATWGSLAYTQYGNLPLVQIVSLTGIWGLTFLMAWAASVAEWAWEKGFVWPDIKKGVTICTAVLTLVLLFGGARLTFFPPQSQTVCVASITKPERFLLWFTPDLRRESICANSEAERDYFIEASRRAAREGAGLVFWQEAAVLLFREDEKSFVDRGCTLAREERIHLVMSLILFPSAYPKRPWVNKLVYIDSQGNVTAEYQKARPSALEPIDPGDGVVPVLDASFGKFASVVCCDATYPDLIRQAGKGGAGLLLIPALVWEGVDPLYTRMNSFRALENGLSLIQATGRGLSLAVDHQGRVRAALDYSNTRPQIMLSHVPAGHTGTLYSLTGDLFAWICMAGFLAFAVRAAFFH